MNRLLTAFAGLSLFSFQAQAMVMETVTEETFAGYANTFITTNSVLGTNLGSATTSDNWSYDEGVNAGVITDTSAGTSTLGMTASSGNSISLGFDASIVNRPGENDLKLFFVGGNGHVFDVTIGGITNSYNLAPMANAISGKFDPAFPTDPIIGLGINLDSFGLSGGSFSEISLTIGDSYTADSAVPSFVGTYSVETAVVPVPAAVWLFGSGLLGLIGIARRRK